MTADREFDIVVFGASGFTGKVVAERVARTGLKWASAGRSMKKLEALATDLVGKGVVESTSDVCNVVADVNNKESMVNLCRRTKLLLNCTGPFRYYGEPVVAACVNNGTHYLDITGEPEFIEKMMLNYNQNAIDNNVLVVSACGFDSIPADIGAAHNAAQFPAEGSANSVENFLTIFTGPAGYSANATTFECAVLGFANTDELKRVRKALPNPTVPRTGPRLKRNTSPYWESRVGRYCLPFPGSDAAIVRRSQMLLVLSGLASPRPFQFAAYFTLTNWWSVFKVVVVGAMFKFLTGFQWGRNALIKYPEVFSFGAFSRDGPTDAQREQASFEMEFVGRGYQKAPAAGADSSQLPPDWEVVTKVSGGDPGYSTCAVCITQAAVTLLKEIDSLPRGVVTPAAAFRRSGLVDRLSANGVQFSTVSSGPIGGSGKKE